MTIKELKETRYLKFRIRDIKERIEVLRAIVEGASRRYDCIPYTPYGDRTADTLVKISELEQELISKVFDYEMLAEKIEHEINSIPEPYSTVIRLRYIGGYEWIEISEEIHYSIPHCHRLRAEALKMLDIDG